MNVVNKICLDVLVVELHTLLKVVILYSSRNIFAEN